MSSSQKFNFFIHAHPDISKPIGGVKQLHRLCEAFQMLGLNAFVIHQSSKFRPTWFSSNSSILSFKQWDVMRHNPSLSSIQVFPETYLPNHVRFLDADSKYIIFNQNSSYTFSNAYQSKNLDPSEPESIRKKIFNAYNHPNLLAVFVVSDYDHDFVSRITNAPVFKIVNSVDSIFLHGNPVKKMQICYMPRKNVSHSQLVLSMFHHLGLTSGWSIQPISNMTQQEVFNVMSESILFLSFGHPEGFGLPVAEALCSGCSVIGYSGLGGRELFLNPYIPKCENISVANSIEYGDIQSFLSVFSSLTESFSSSYHDFAFDLTQSTNFFRAAYNFKNTCVSLSSSLDKLVLPSL